MRQWLAVALLALGPLLAGCSDSTGPEPAQNQNSLRDTLLLTFSSQFDTTEVRIMDGESGEILHRRLLMPGHSRIFGTAADRERREFIALLSNDPLFHETSPSTRVRELVAFGFPDLEVLWREDLEAIAAGSTRDLSLRDFLGIGGGGAWLWMSAVRHGPLEYGIVVLDRASREIVAFLGGFAAKAEHIAEVTDPAGEDLLVVGGRRTDGDERLIIFEETNLQVRDSVFLTTGHPKAGSRKLKRLVSAHDGSHVFALTRDSLRAVDIRKREVTARIQNPRPAFNQGEGVPKLTALSDPPRLFLTSPDLDDAFLRVYDFALNDLGAVQLSLNEIPGSIMMDITPGVSGDRVFVGTGTQAVQPFLQFEVEAAVWVVSVDPLTLLHGYALNRFGLTSVHAF